jgi:ribosomal protein S18 acetylase RimI-like enzyme
MIEVDEGTWRASYETRLRNWYGACSAVAPWVDHFVRLRLSRWDEVAEKHLFEVDGGVLAVAVVGPPATVLVVDCRGEAALGAAIAWATGRAGQLGITLPPGAPAYFERLPLRATGMLKPLVAPPPAVEGVTVRAMTEAEFGPWLAAQMDEYVREMTESGLLSAEEARARARKQFDQALPDGVHSAGQSFLRLEAGGEVVGTNWVTHRYEPGTSWVQGVEIGPEYRGKGYGRAAMLFGEAAAIEAGDAQLGLNVFGHNEVAMHLYESLGYRPVEIFRSIELQDANGGVPPRDQRRGQQEDPDGGAA